MSLSKKEVIRIMRSLERSRKSREVPPQYYVDKLEERAEAELQKIKPRPNP